jgi:integrase
MSAKGQPRMRREATGVFLRGRRWWISYSGPRADGSWGELFESSGSEDQQDAVRLRKKRVRQVENHREGLKKFHQPTEAGRVTVGGLLDNLLADYETRRLKSIRQVRVHLAHVRAALGSLKAAAVDRSTVEHYIADRRTTTKKLPQGAADGSIDREVEILRRAFNLAKESGGLAYVPSFPPRLVRGAANARQGFVERADFEKLIAELPSEVLRDLATWAYATGMRRGEILALTWEGYDRETKTLRLHARNAKTGKGRMIPLSGYPAAAAVIERRLRARRFDCALIFHSEGHHVGDFSTTWLRACKRAGVEFTFHDLRRTAIRNMIRAGIDRTVAKRISGHETDSVFERYNITSEADLEDAMRKRAEYEAKLPTESSPAAIRQFGPSDQTI